MRCEWLSVLMAAILAGCAGDGGTSQEVLRPGLFAGKPEPVFAPPSRGELILAEAAAASAGDAGVRNLPVAPAVGVMAVAKPFAGLEGCVVRQQQEPRTALGLAAADGLLGQRALAVFNSSQLAQVAGELAQCASWNVNSGVVVLVLDDPACRFSSARIDAFKLASSTGLPTRQAFARNIYNEVQDAFMTSERFRVPFILIVGIDELLRPVPYTRVRTAGSGRPYSGNLWADVMTPALAVYRSMVLEAKSIGGSDSAVMQPALPVLPDSLPARYRDVFELYKPAMSVLSGMKNKIGFASSEGQALGFFAFEPYGVISAAGFPGAAVPLAIRAFQQRLTPAVAVMNAEDFLKFGPDGVWTAAGEGAAVKVLVFNTGTAEAAGAVPASRARFDAALAGLPVNLTRISYNVSKREFEELFARILASPDMELVVIDYE